MSQTRVNTRVVTFFHLLSDALSTLPDTNFVRTLEGALLEVRKKFFNQAPIASPIQQTTNSDGQIVGSIAGRDPEGDPVVYSVVSDPQFGTVEVAEDGSYLYTPGADYDGSDRFTVEVSCDAKGSNIVNPRGEHGSTQVIVGVGTQAATNPFAAAAEQDPIDVALHLSNAAAQVVVTKKLLRTTATIALTNVAPESQIGWVDYNARSGLVSMNDMVTSYWQKYQSAAEANGGGVTVGLTFTAADGTYQAVVLTDAHATQNPDGTIILDGVLAPDAESKPGYTNDFWDIVGIGYRTAYESFRQKYIETGSFTSMNFTVIGADLFTDTYSLSDYKNLWTANESVGGGVRLPDDTGSQSAAVGPSDTSRNRNAAAAQNFDANSLSSAKSGMLPGGSCSNCTPLPGFRIEVTAQLGDPNDPNGVIVGLDDGSVRRWTQLGGWTVLRAGEGSSYKSVTPQAYQPYATSAVTAMARYGDGFVIGTQGGQVEQWTGNGWKVLGKTPNGVSAIVPYKTGLLIGSTTWSVSSFGYQQNSNTEITQWDGQNFTQIASFGDDAGSLVGLMTYSNNSLAAVATSDDRVRQWDGKNWTTLPDTSYSGAVTAMMPLSDVDLNGDAFDGFVIGQLKGGVSEWNGTAWTDLGKLSSPVTAFAPIAFGDQPGSFIAGLEDGTVEASYVRNNRVYGMSVYQRVPFKQLRDGQSAQMSDGSVNPVKTIISYPVVADVKVRVATSSAGSIIGLDTGAAQYKSDFAGGRVVDGVTLAVGDRILLKNQADASENGIYVVTSDIPTRDTTTDTESDYTVSVTEGTANANSTWSVVGTDTWSKSVAASWAASRGVVSDTSVRVATTSDTPLYGKPWYKAGSVIDGVTLNAGDRILITEHGETGDTTDVVGAEYNGVFVINATGDPTRDTSLDSLSSYTVAVSEGAVNGKTYWTMSGAQSATADRDPLASTKVWTGNYLQTDFFANVATPSTNTGTVTGTDFAAGQVLDGVTLAADSLILVTNQPNPYDNGLYRVTSGAPTPLRPNTGASSPYANPDTSGYGMNSIDFLFGASNNTDGPAASGQLTVIVAQGDTNGRSYWTLTGTQPARWSASSVSDGFVVGYSNGAVAQFNGNIVDAALNTGWKALRSEATSVSALAGLTTNPPVGASQWSWNGFDGLPSGLNASSGNASLVPTGDGFALIVNRKDGGDQTFSKGKVYDASVSVYTADAVTQLDNKGTTDTTDDVAKYNADGTPVYGPGWLEVRVSADPVSLTPDLLKQGVKFAQKINGFKYDPGTTSTNSANNGSATAGIGGAEDPLFGPDALGGQTQPACLSSNTCTGRFFYFSYVRDPEYPVSLTKYNFCLDKKNPDPRGCGGTYSGTRPKGEDAKNTITNQSMDISLDLRPTIYGYVFDPDGVWAVQDVKDWSAGILMATAVGPSFNLRLGGRQDGVLDVARTPLIGPFQPVNIPLPLGLGTFDVRLGVDATLRLNIDLPDDSYTAGPPIYASAAGTVKAVSVDDSFRALEDVGGNVVDIVTADGTIVKTAIPQCQGTRDGKTCPSILVKPGDVVTTTTALTSGGPVDWWKNNLSAWLYYNPGWLITYNTVGTEPKGDPATDAPQTSAAALQEVKEAYGTGTCALVAGAGASAANTCATVAAIVADDSKNWGTASSAYVDWDWTDFKNIQGVTLSPSIIPYVDASLGLDAPASWPWPFEEGFSVWRVAVGYENPLSLNISLPTCLDAASCPTPAPTYSVGGNLTFQAGILEGLPFTKKLTWKTVFPLYKETLSPAS